MEPVKNESMMAAPDQNSVEQQQQPSKVVADSQMSQEDKPASQAQPERQREPSGEDNADMDEQNKEDEKQK